uniref:Uncharacterized protein n=1 Tax=Tanacetum cinerariifolium TaxID=118510 RepID=A0A699IHH4_TANCI|nr:hypothetical protein [Tanacetum cinerariifolium]
MALEYILFVCKKVAGIWMEDNDNITTYKRSIIVYGRSEYPTHLQPYFACYDPLSYLLFFPNVHLPNKQFVTFEEDVVLIDILEKERNKRSMLTAFFELNQTDTEARQHLYKDIPKFYTWNKSTRKWNRRKQGKMRGRMGFANPAEGERFYLRVLLQHVKRPTGFDYLYTINDVLYITFRGAALERGLRMSSEYIILMYNY